MDELLHRLHLLLFPLLWGAWGAYWALSAADVKSTTRREPALSRALHLGPLAFAAWLLWTPHSPWPALDRPLVPASDITFWCGAALTVAGLAFTVWARRHLGRNWSAIVTLKQDHELVTSGPYAWVRHPIYTGLLFGFIGSAIARDEWRGVLAVLLVAASLWRKLRLEERWMHERFGPAYKDYARRSKALIPFVL